MVMSLTSIIETSSENHSGNQLWRAACFAVKPKVYLYLISTTMPMGTQIKQKACHRLGQICYFWFTDGICRQVTLLRKFHLSVQDIPIFKDRADWPLSQWEADFWFTDHVSKQASIFKTADEGRSERWFPEVLLCYLWGIFWEFEVTLSLRPYLSSKPSIFKSTFTA